MNDNFPICRVSFDVRLLLDSAGLVTSLVTTRHRPCNVHYVDGVAGKKIHKTEDLKDIQDVKSGYGFFC